MISVPEAYGYLLGLIILCAILSFDPLAVEIPDRPDDDLE
jgi:hypothetical protein